MVTWRLPIFNLECGIWHGRLPATLTLPALSLPTDAPDVIADCQLYRPRYTYGQELHAYPDTLSNNLLKRGTMELRLPKDTDIRAPWFAAGGLLWSQADLVEVPRGSGRWYLVTNVDQAHMGFANEYRVAILAQIANLSAAALLPIGFSAAAISTPPGSALALPFGFGTSGNSTPPGLTPALPFGIGLDWTGFAPVWSSYLPFAGGLDASGSPTLGRAALPFAGGLDASGSPTLGRAALPFAAAEKATIVTPADLADLPMGFGPYATTATGSNVVPGSSCAGAGAGTIPWSGSYSIASGQTHWFSFPITSGVQYFVTFVQTSGNAISANLGTGSCPTPGQYATLNSLTPCAAHTPLSNGTGFIWIFGPLIGTANYNLQVATGACPP